MNDFKQIIGRGTRTFEGKDFLIIWDFVKAHENFNDPKWDGEPEEPVQPVPHVNDPSESQEPELPPGTSDEPPETIIIKLADGGRAYHPVYLCYDILECRWKPDDGRTIH